MDLRATARTLAVPPAAAALLAALTACGGAPDPAPVPASSPAPASAVSATSAPASPSVPDREPHTLVLNATGEGKLTQITYTLDGKTQQRGVVTLPWRQSLTVAADGKPHQWTLGISYAGGTKGNVDMFSIVDGKEGIHTAAAAAGSPGSHISGSASVGGTVQG
ncbi:hypothetical protein [Amycolatopsis sp. FDAARGOS 1241]|uniref:hypothetical protein n=1 Tax=Amycolatopsis sp. FDAARGOS 1241 TaxID=2778070 RepID=UPI00194F4FA0|nr:hypothetical protein [Amycolatopsis sp. FDAARGOS 1241]QRP49821.1 hypothetical protein I6J71_20025 [Amycolatopsis sp. FDAARGOS 1241]